MPSPDQMGSPFPAARAMPLSDGYGGKITAQDELPIHALGDDYAVEGSGTVSRFPALPSGIMVHLRMIGAPTFKNSARLICQNGVDYAASAGDLAIARSDGDGVWRLFVLPASGSVRAVRTRIFTSSGTYTPSSGMLYAIVECIGGGGGGGGSSGTAGGIYAGGGGGSGGYSRSIVTAATVGASKAVTIGAAGTGGGAGNNNGIGGGDTSVAALCIGKGGSGGLFGASAQLGSGGSGGVAGTGDIASPGMPGGGGIYASIISVALPAGAGGSSCFGGGGRPGTYTLGTALAGTSSGGYGGGGSGAISPNIATAVAGGDGSAGVVFITEYCSQ